MTTKRTHHGWMVLFRFSDRKFLEELRKHGHLHMKPSARFSELEKEALATCSTVDPVRADRFEGADFIYHPKEHEIVIEGPGALDSHGKPQNFKVSISPEEIQLTRRSASMIFPATYIACTQRLRLSVWIG